MLLLKLASLELGLVCKLTAVSAVLGIAAAVPAWFTIYATAGHYPPSLFRIEAGLLRWTVLANSWQYFMRDDLRFLTGHRSIAASLVTVGLGAATWVGDSRRPAWVA